MSNILILYYSRHGSILALANEIARGVESIADAEAVMRTAAPVMPAAAPTGAAAGAGTSPAAGDLYVCTADLENCDALILGSPTRFGSIAAPLKYVFEQTTPQWLSGALKDKPAAVFTSSASLHGGQESTLLGMMLPLLHHGMLLLGIPYSGTRLGQTQSGGTPYGASHVAGADNSQPISDDEKKLAYLLGRRVAGCARALAGQSL